MTTTSPLLRATLALAATAALVTPFAAQAQAAKDPSWMVRVRAVNIDSANKDSTGLGLAINDKLIPEIDISYFFTPQIAAELVLTYPQKHKITATGVQIGTLKHLPPTLTLQYHFPVSPSFKPYVGAGFNYTRFSSVSFNPAVVTALAPSIERSSVGLAFQAGADFKIGENTYLNVDLKKVQIRTDVSSFGAKAGTFKVDPWLLGVGVGWRF